MNLARRSFLRKTLGAGVLAASATSTARSGSGAEEHRVTDDQLVRAAEAPVLQVDGLTAPLRIASMELLKNGRNFLVRVRTSGGDEGLGVPNAMRLLDVYPLFVRKVAPFFVGKDARARTARSGSFTATATTTSSRDWPSGSAWRPPSSRSSTCSGKRPASRSATCSAASSAARSPFTAPAAPGATRPRPRSRT